MSSQTIYDGIRKIIDNPNIEHYYFDRDNDGYKYGFVFRGVKENIPDFIFDDSNLTGGDVDTKPVINLKKW